MLKTSLCKCNIKYPQQSCVIFVKISQSVKNNIRVVFNVQCSMPLAVRFSPNTGAYKNTVIVLAQGRVKAPENLEKTRKTVPRILQSKLIKCLEVVCQSVVFLCLKRRRKTKVRIPEAPGSVVPEDVPFFYSRVHSSTFRSFRLTLRGLCAVRSAAPKSPSTRNAGVTGTRRWPRCVRGRA